MQKPTDGAQRHPDRSRIARPQASSASRINGRSIRAVRALRSWFRVGSTHVRGSLTSQLAAPLRSLGTAERALPVAVAAIVAVASLLALLPNTTQGAVGGTQGRGSGVRLAVGGGGVGFTEADIQSPDVAAGLARGHQSFTPVVLPGDVITEPGAASTPADTGAFLADGTLITGYAPSTTVEDGANLIQTYKVKSGDTLVGVAHKFHISMMTLWWANKLKTKSDLHIGQVLRIPPVSGLVVTVKDTDTLDVLAAQYGVDPAEIINLNGLADPTLVVGQVLVLPGAKGEPIAIPTPKPTPKPKPVVRPQSSTSGSGSAHSSGGAGVGVRYTGGAMHWPVIGGANYISQYYHYGHYGLDIAAAYGSQAVAAADGRVIFAGWKSNGGGYQVWISHGNNVFTTYNHMSAISVGNGETVSRGEQVGRVGATGNATGSHLHFEVWIGEIWNGGTRMNPLRYF